MLQHEESEDRAPLLPEVKVPEGEALPGVEETCALQHQLGGLGIQGKQN